MKPVLAFPYNDPDGTMLPHLLAILPDLKVHFERAYISPPPSTLKWLRQKNPLLADDFFVIFPTETDMPVGKRFAFLYQRTAVTAHPEQQIHLCFPDRLFFALKGGYREAFLADVDSLSMDDLPLIFQRSEYAWATHPKIYRRIEGIVTTVGKNLFGIELDYAWCHMVIQAKQLGRLIPFVNHPEISMVAEMAFYLQEEVKTRDVDWLAWEDPLVLNREADELKAERENSLEEINKRLNYVLPMIELLTRFSKNERKS